MRKNGMRKSAALVTAVGIAVGAVVQGATAAEAARQPAKAADFNGDGRADIVAGRPDLTVKGRKKAGGILVLDGARRPGEGWRTLTRDTPGVPDRSRSRERFGVELVSGDFDRDGFADLAVGTSGKVVVLYGSKKGLTGKRSKEIAPGFPAQQQGPGSAQGTSDSLRFGTVMSSGDYNGDGYADLAVRSDRGKAGVLVLRGGAKGLTTKRAVRLTDGRKGFGTFLASADVTGDGRADLVASQPPAEGSGAQRFTLLPGSSSGPRTATATRWTTPADRPLRFALGDLDGDGRADLVRTEAPDADGPTGFATQLSTGKSFAAPRVTETGGDAPASGVFAVGDLTGDGRGDVLAGLWAFASYVALYPGTAQGVGPRLRVYGGESEAVAYAAHASLVNVAGDSRADALFTSRDGYGGARLHLHTAGTSSVRVLRSASGTSDGFTLLSH
ncbi:VCBS repeat-containing protein [Actinocorallia sp. A-T 12471]|uniref:FG-GAP repeat domain-containing protein n=1 Tax=Actinocorallia sp. A-T 12471 TaxID=3089813 RepID=UPI0029D12C4E|nr:VCBS repeat-containing protein [Actinocorallia sp. A-T 12471]MDX6738713.1 VCBS repeat-containing protein [Actinocorallia sp. A-T 12471]